MTATQHITAEGPESFLLIVAHLNIPNADIFLMPIFIDICCNQANFAANIGINYQDGDQILLPDVLQPLLLLYHTENKHPLITTICFIVSGRGCQ